MLKGNHRDSIVWKLACISAGFVVTAAFDLPAQSATPLGPPEHGKVDFPPWGVRRSITAQDRAQIAAYRSEKKGHLVYSTNFIHPEELKDKWILKSDDVDNLKSCRRPENITVSDHGLLLSTKLATDSKKKWSTGTMWSNFRQKFGFFECNMKIADCHGINNAFWLVTTDHFEIDICEVHYPGTVRSTLHNNQLAYNTPHSAGFVQKFQDNFSEQYHDFGALWTPNTIIFEVDGEPFAAIDTNNSIQGAADIRFSSAVTEYGGPITAHPENHDMRVRSLRVSSLK